LANRYVSINLSACLTYKVLTIYRARNGYGQSKLVAESLLSEAAKTSHVPVAICRVCQGGGPVGHGLKGSWNEREWVPALISSCQKLQMMPATLGFTDMLDWVPVDTVARIVIELLLGTYKASAQLLAPTQQRGMTLFRRRSKDLSVPASCKVYHISNPTQVSWQHLVPTIAHHLGKEVKVVSILEWTEALRAAATTVWASEIPGLKLWDFFDDIRDKATRFPDAKAATLEIRCTRRMSPTLDRLPPVSTEWMDLWMRQWDLTGMIQSQAWYQSPATRS
jgi:thioester reductase-like protein